MRKTLEISRIPRTKIAVLAGASPGILALMLMFATRGSTTYRHIGWIKYLIEHQDVIIQTLILSSVMAAVFSVLLRSKVATFAAGLQTLAIQIMFLLTDASRHIALNLSLAAIIILPLLILLMPLKKEDDQVDDQDKDEKTL